MKRRTVKVLKWTGIGVVILGVLYAGLLLWANRSLRRAYAELQADGRPMKVDDIIPPPIPDTENAALVYQAVVLLLRAEPGEEQNLFTEMSSLASEMRDAPEDAEHTARFRELLRNEVAHEALASLERGTLRPGCRYDVDYSQGAGTLMPHLRELRNLTRIVCAVAQVQAADGDHAAAWRSAMTALRLCNAVKDEPFVISQLVRIAQFSLAAESIHTLAARSLPSEEQHAEMEALLESFDDVGPLVAAMDGERLLVGEWAFNLPRSEWREVVGMAGSDGSAVLAWATRAYPLFRFDHAAYVRVMHAYAKNAAEPYSTADADLADELIDGIPWYCVLTEMLVPALARVKGNYVAMTARSRITRAGLAALRHRREHEAFPENLAAVDLSGLTDPFSGKPLAYRPEPEGFVISSVGENLTDEGGTPADSSQDGDLVWRYHESAGTEPDD